MSISSADPCHQAVTDPIEPVAGGWCPDERPIRILYVSLAIFFVMLMAGGLVGYARVPHPANDYFAFESYSRFIHRYEPALIYDQARLRNFQALPGHKVFAFMYPPSMLLLVWPLALLPHLVGYLAWIGIGAAACAGTVGLQRGGWPIALLVAIAPSTLWTALCGQSTLLVSALIVGGLLLSPRRPIVAGLLLGIATYKPQLGLLVPVALVASRQWRTIASAIATFAAVSLATTLAFGPAIWFAWLSHVGSIVDVRTQHAATWAPLLATVASDLSTLGLGRREADLGQVLALAATSVCIWRCFSRRNDSERIDAAATRLKAAALGAATFLATPFAFIYDLPLFTAAVLLFADERRRAGAPFHSLEILAIVAGLLDPCIFLIDGAHCLGTVVVLFVLFVILSRLSALRDAARHVRSELLME